ncbi:hypothetical protein HCQ94_04810 [Actinomyces sp. zg-332]|nr:hypothetical protein [Actinomyces sp. zg-332]QPK93902.1 hypothetical protein HCQ94_04810 [Actinomyces sp. zg-332]
MFPIKPYFVAANLTALATFSDTFSFHRTSFKNTCLYFTNTQVYVDRQE